MSLKLYKVIRLKQQHPRRKQYRKEKRLFVHLRQKTVLMQVVKLGNVWNAKLVTFWTHLSNNALLVGMHSFLALLVAQRLSVSVARTKVLS